MINYIYILQRINFQNLEFDNYNDAIYRMNCLLSCVCIYRIVIKCFAQILTYIVFKKVLYKK